MSNPLGIKEGDRIRLISMGDDPDPIPNGTTGRVRGVTELDFRERKETQIQVNWDNGRSLSCICPPDIIERVAAD